MSTPPTSPRTTPTTEPPVLHANAARTSNQMERIIPARNIPALTSWYLGVFGLIPILGIPLSLAAIASGIYGIKVASRPDIQVGRGHAIAGIMLGTLMGGVLPVIIIFLLNIDPSFFGFLD